ncbi:bifunctional serine/threonine-protein kinase/formylglycine-generating enzyme family protein [Coleofasciculus sp. FACHB-SPT9]|uniref:bifunctional serine/threonine-protein kinase/formylglycine-generating enzyme family protein n=1 Tax=Cyanophyceae TaxID=3028117 RepID=UPI001689A500|nr:bifunctional serine/threonine-protein kinase/formylglycine-generating enzyme family protein [Coleofasciculus sp. FACHB-SPT9]MBD1890357.1 SUMF1/EgtB/PvdO family nonheme iron enzyme [Coleofasciculus sp. FACHB-SPT9]
MSYCLNPACQKCQNSHNDKFCKNCGTKLVLLGRYRTLAPLGQGGFGRTFRAIDEAKPSKPACVIKQFFPIQQGTNTANKAAELFHQEAVRLEELGNHPQIPELLAHFEEENRQYLVQQFINGQNLAHILEQKGVFNETEIRTLLTDLLRVLEFVHGKQVIHRDIKPENIIRRQVDNQLVLVDFGAAKFATGTALARTGTVIGDFRYIAPEQAVGKGVFASDLYSLGVTCIHLLTNVEPLELFDTDEDTWVWQSYLPNPLSDELRSILDKMIQRGAKRRYQSAEDVIKAITPQKLSVAPTILNIPQASPLKTFDFDVVTVNAQGMETNRCRMQAKYFSEDLDRGMTLEMVEIPGGTFLMGSPDMEKKRNSNESPQHQVTVAPFFMGKFTVTQAQWKAVANLPKINRDIQPDPSYFKGTNRPVENVSWHDTVEFCARLSKKTGKSYRLPSETQWEYACRAGTTTPFHVGDTITTNLANYDGNSTYASEPKGKYRLQTTEVGSFLPNAFGLYDMHGNVWEWCADIWHPSYKGAPNDGNAWESEGDNSFRLLRSGSCINDPWDCRSAVRGRNQPDSNSRYFGFRVVTASA